MRVEALGVFVEGLLSFLSPCVLPLVPLYMTYLSGNSDNSSKKKSFVRTLAFCIGMSLTFLLMGFSLSWLKEYIDKASEIIGLCGGLILVLFAFQQLGWIHFGASEKSYRLPVQINPSGMSCLKAFLMGFLFTFSWTPCIGPMLGNVLLLGTQQPLYANLYLFLYALGFILPFLILGLFTECGLNLLSRHKKVMLYTGKIAAVILLCFGLYMFADNSGKIMRLKEDTNQNTNGTVYTDQYGRNVYLSDYEGEPLYMNFIATWCTYCIQEIPDYQAFLKEKDLNGVFVMSPDVNNQGGMNDIMQFAEDNGIEITIIVDENNVLFQKYGISAFPSLYVLDKEGEVIGYTTGMLKQENFKAIHEEVLKRINEKEAE